MKNLKGSSEESSSGSSPKTNRRDFVKMASFGGAGLGMAINNLASETGMKAFSYRSPSESPSKVIITDLKCAIIGGSPVIRVVTSAGISGYGQAESAKSFLKPYVLFYKDYVVGMDPTDVNRIMLKIRRLGSHKPWGSAVSAIEMALWDATGKIYSLPVYKLLGGKIRDKVRVYGRTRSQARGPGELAAELKASKEGFTIIKMGGAFHSKLPITMPDFYYGEAQEGSSPGNRNPILGPGGEVLPKTAPHPNRGPLTEKGLKTLIEQVEKVKIALGDEVGLALDYGPGFMLSDAIRLARALEPYNLMWVEDLLTGDYYPYVKADLYRELTTSTSTPIHTGEQIYLRENFRELIETNAVNVLGPDPADIGGLAELKWVAEYADLHSIMMAPHGIGDGMFGLAAHVQLAATLPENYIAFEYPNVVLFNENSKWWYDIVEGLPDPFIRDGMIEVWDRPGIGIDFRVKEAKKYLREEDLDFFN
jgi:L-alanine-DL-glutamate epimerase-like enolase superfamily enzyme